MKNFRFKSTATAIMVVTTLSGCLKNFSEESIIGEEIVFCTPNIFRTESKTVTETSLDDLSDNGFKVLAKVNSDQSTLFNTLVQKENGVWKVPGKKYYFPTGATMDFYALYPGNEEIALTGEDKKATLGYTVTTNDDLVAASALGVTPTTSAIPLEFSHILSQMAFTFVRSDMTLDYTLNSIVIKAPKTGTFDFASGCWNNLSDNPTDFPVIPSGSTLTISSSATQAGDMMTFIPGNLTAAISWSCSQDGKEIATYKANVEFTAVQGKKTIIECTLPNCDGDAIAFTVTADSWDESQKQINIINASDIIPGEFTVDAYGKKVQFSRGNLFWNGTQFKFEEHQYDSPQIWDPNHVGLFFWSRDAADSYAENLNENGPGNGEVFFAADGGAIEGWTVLTMRELGYVFENALAKNSQDLPTIIIDGIGCVVLKSDGFTGTVADSYSAEEWAAAEKLGLVALPISGEREGRYGRGTTIRSIGTLGGYWTTTISETWGASSFYVEQINNNKAETKENYCGYARSIRLVREIQGAMPDATYSVYGQTKVSLPEAALPNGALIKIDWGDGKTDYLSNSRGGKASFIHSYCSEFTGKIKIYVPEGAVDFGEVTPDIYKNFYVNNTNKVLVSGLFPLGPFTVNDSGKQVYFSHGNLYWNGLTQEFAIEKHQYDIPLRGDGTDYHRYDLSHVCRFYWSNDIRVACTQDYEETLDELGIVPSKNDKLFAADGGVFEGWTVLSADEWQYLLDHNAPKDIWEWEGVTYTELPWVTIYDHTDGRSISHGYVLTPDGFTGTLNAEYDEDGWPEYGYTIDEWAEFERTYGAVFLPDNWYAVNGYTNAGSGSYYWSTSIDPEDDTKAACTNDYEITICYSGKRYARGIRLVKVIEGTGN